MFEFTGKIENDFVICAYFCFFCLYLFVSYIRVKRILKVVCSTDTLRPHDHRLHILLLPSGCSLGLNLLAPADMDGICCGLAFDAAVSINVATSTTLCGDTSPIWVGEIRTGLGRPVAASAVEFACVSWTKRSGFHHSASKILQFSIIRAFDTQGNKTGHRVRKCEATGMQLFDNQVQVLLRPNYKFCSALCRTSD